MRQFCGLRCLPVVCLVAASAGVASANTIGYSGILTLSPDPGDTTNGFELTLQKFDPSLGTLTGVRLYFREDLSVTGIQLQNDNANEVEFNVGVYATLTNTFSNSARSADVFTGEMVSIYDTGKLGSGIPGSCAAQGLGTGGDSSPILPGDCTPVTVAAHSTYDVSYNGSPISATNPYLISNTLAVYGYNVETGVNGLTGVEKTVAAAGRSSYVGTGTFTFRGTTLTDYALQTGSSNLGASLTAARLIWAEVDYDYDPFETPEPVTFTLMGSALAGIAMLRKRFAQ